jgi:hypothetical protein
MFYSRRQPTLPRSYPRSTIGHLFGEEGLTYPFGMETGVAPPLCSLQSTVYYLPTPGLQQRNGKKYHKSEEPQAGCASLRYLLITCHCSPVRASNFDFRASSRSFEFRFSMARQLPGIRLASNSFGDA